MDMCELCVGGFDQDAAAFTKNAIIKTTKVPTWGLITVQGKLLLNEANGV